MYRILSLDGGGIRGLYTLLMILKLEGIRPGWLDRVDLIAGTSVGGIIAIGLAAGFAPSDLAELFSDKGALIFPAQKFAGKLKQSPLIGPKYANDGLTSELIARFGNMRLKDLEKGVIISSFCLDNKGHGGKTRSWGPKFFHNLDSETGDMEEQCWKVALYTSAAPTYFPSVDGYIDGGVAINNPSMCAFALAKKHMVKLGMNDDISLLSIGTGLNSRYIDKNTTDWGILKWSSYLLPLLMDAPSGIAEYQSRAVLGENYMRINSTISEEDPVGLDEISGISRLVQAAKTTDLEATARWLECKWM